MEKLNRILDANVNRVAEGIRVIEDICRFYFEDEEKTERLRKARHLLRKTFAKQDIDFINSRDSLHDIGLNISANSTLDKKSSLYQVVTANSKRVTEGLRAIEETSKIVNLYKESKVVESLRYEFYSLNWLLQNFFDYFFA